MAYGYDDSLRLSTLADGAATVSYDELGRVAAIAGPRVADRAFGYARWRSPSKAPTPAPTASTSTAAGLRPPAAA